MDEVDIEDVEDLSELEARLYAQIHHEPSNDTGFSTDFKEALPVRQVTATSVVNNKSLDKTRVGRYWNDKKSVYIPPTKPTQINLDQSVQEHNVSSSLSGGVREPPAETVDKSFQPSVKNLSNLRVNPFASGNGPNKKGSSSNDLAKNAPATKTKITDQKEKGPFARQIKKLATAVKYDKKRQKAEISKRKPKSDSKVHTIEPTEAIELLSSQDSDQDDVIEVPLSPQKILTIESSSEDESCENKTDFVKPKTTTVKENPSRCTSPCSVISDDFISQSDRMRHLKECDGPDDEDLLMLQEDVDSLLENPQKNSNEASTSGLHLSETPDYRVTQSSFRAFDVYESESDIQDSVYSKGSKPSVVVRIDHESSSGDDVEEINITQKTKRLRKRATSSNKESDTYIDSTDSEEENQNDELSKSRDGVVRTNISFIAHGEALEKCLTDEQSVGRNNAKNSSDKEFLSTLKALAQGTPLATSRASKPESEEEDEVITARAIAENVLQKENASKQSSDAVTGNKQDRNDAVPTETFQELTDAFGKIDDLDKNAVVVDDDSDDNSDKSVELVAPLPVVPQSPLYRKRIETHTGDPIYHIVYSEGNSWTGGIGWNDEMRKFYNNSWKGERFTVNSVCSQMKSARSLWKIYTDDPFPKFHRNPNQKCVNCLEFGHFRSKCPKPKRPLICYMCGERGHHEPRCPNTVCLRCGNKTRMFTRSCNACNYQNRLICPICKVRGHNLNLCPDKWRRYHSTTKPNEYPNSNVEYKNRKFCCICGCRGHLAEHCRNGLRYSEYPIFISEIRSHQKSYDDIAIKSLRSGIGYNLMYKPEEDYAFSLAENKTKQHYYGRFLIAVGMGYMLRRKRKRDESQDSGPSEKQPKPVTGHFKEYIVNPFASAALGMAPREKPTTSDKSITVVNNSVDDPVIEVPSKSGPGESMTCTQVDLSTDQCDVYKQQPGDNPKASNSEYQPSTGTFKRPDASPTRTTGPSRKESDLEIIDSDSNYSFSDHFETIIQQKPREMAPLPDFIPITDDGDIYPDETVGISNAFVSADTDDEETNRTLNDIPCEAKIYLTNFHSKFLLRPEGNKFLVERSKVYDIKARLDWTSVGDILILFGLRENQDKFHMELLHRFRELSDNLNRKHLENSQKVPKKTEVLIRFLRENLAQLQTDLGNVYELSTRLPQYEQQNTKNGWKAAEKTRRTLNMILIGQTGLRNGATHLDNLLSHLRKLIDECKDDVVPNDVRDDIEHNWKVIFSSYRHKNYDQLVKLYQRAPVKNRLHTFNIDPRLLGKGLLDTTLTKAQKDKMNKCTDELKDQPTTTEKQSGSPRMICNPAAVKFQARQAKTPTSEKKRLKQSTNLTNQQQQVQALSSPVANKINAVNAEWENKCVNLLTEIDSIAKVKSGPVNDSKASSMFWSREAMPYIDQCLQLGKSNSGLMEKLSRVSIKSSKGLLSYNDYRAIIKIHTAIKGKK